MPVTLPATVSPGSLRAVYEALVDLVAAFEGTGASAQMVQGTVADDAVEDLSGPLKNGGVVSSTYTSGPAAGDRAHMTLTPWRGLRVSIGSLSQGEAAVGATVLSAVGASNLGLFANSHGRISNGSTWDPVRKPNAASRIASAGASVNATSAKGTPGDAFRIMGNNVKASVIYCKLYNKGSAPTVGTDVPVLTIPIPASGVFNLPISEALGYYFSTGIAYGFTTDAADNGTTALSAGDILDFCLTYH